MIASNVIRSNLQTWRESIVNKAIEWSPNRGTARSLRSPHFWIITVLMALFTFLYYVDRTPLAGTTPFNSTFFSGVHDLHRTLFVIPIVYAAFIFRLRGSIITSAIFLGVVLPRALMFSPYPDPLLRAILFVVVMALASLLIATQLDRAEREQKARAELSAAYQELEENQEKLIQAEKMTSLGQLAASVAHEVNNPIAGVLIYTQLIMKKMSADTLTKEQALDYLSKMEFELTRSGRLIRNLLDFARQTEPSLSLINLNDVAERAFSLVSHSAEIGHVKVIKELSTTLPEIMADPSQLQQVLTNLMLNAIQAMPDGGTLTIRTSADSQGRVRIDVQDTGIGISKENMKKLFTPFFTTKKEVKGVGLGLAVAHGIIQRHRGKIEVESEEGKGTTFTIYLNAYQGDKGQGT
jgi:signal transduction histidine kinase